MLLDEGLCVSEPLITKDISTMESGHSSVREFTKARARGHVANLSEVSAKSVCRFIAKEPSTRSERPAVSGGRGSTESQGSQTRGSLESLSCRALGRENQSADREGTAR